MMFIKFTVILFIFYLLANVSGSIWFSNDDVDDVVSINGLDVNLTWKIMETNYRDSITITKDGYNVNSALIKTMDPNHTIITLHLTHVQMDDSGTYRCTLGLWNTRYKDVNLTIITDLNLEWDITPIKDRLAKDVTLTWRYKQITNKKTLSIYRKQTNNEEKILSIFPDGSGQIKRGLQDVNITVSSDDITETVAFTIYNTTSVDFSYSYSLKIEFRETLYKQTEYIEIIEELNENGGSFQRIKLVYGLLVLVLVVVVIAFLSAFSFYLMKRPHRTANTGVTSNAANDAINNSYESVNTADIITDNNQLMVFDSSSPDLDPYLNPYNETNRTETESDKHDYMQLKICTFICEGDIINGDVEEQNEDSDTPSSHDSESYFHMYDQPNRTKTECDKHDYTQLKRCTIFCDVNNDDVQEINNDSDGRSGNGIDSFNLSTHVGAIDSRIQNEINST
ncbi:uncharacterized protein LOC126817937 isoform X1 [Patella vulgata]|uniref:uncharacterized protein LOC126817937 isoform X1 n=1 Tax=Patella vulgata TaxID=6465 RepID=UPI00217FFFB5|nr:uncharacterized protein LOC126817937 isoform X1 [Patella vulgata]